MVEIIVSGMATVEVWLMILLLCTEQSYMD